MPTEPRVKKKQKKTKNGECGEVLKGKVGRKVWGIAMRFYILQLPPNIGRMPNCLLCHNIEVHFKAKKGPKHAIFGAEFVRSRHQLQN
jgi:hypothetical protein